MRRSLCAGLIAASGVAWPAPEANGIVTILEGEATVLQGRERAAAAEGLHLGAGAIVETSARTSLMRIEIDSAAIDLGPDTRVMLAPEGLVAKGAAAPRLYLLQGWVKLSAAAGKAVPGVISASFEMPAQEGVAVAFVGPDERDVFVESGTVQLAERRGGKSAPPIVLHGGEWFAQQGAERGHVLARQTAAMLERLPRAYRDTLPMRAAKFDGHEVDEKPMPPASYAELQPWLTAEPALRRGFVKRFAPRAREPEFRRALIAHLAEHPEWRPVLFPPEPKPPRPAASLARPS